MEANLSWRKNIDTRYISGEDLKLSSKGLRPEMVVTIDDAKDVETFDRQKQDKQIKTGIYLKEYPSGVKLYKPVILNKTNAQFFENLTKSHLVNDWVNIPVTLYAAADSRHGHVVRFKKYYPPATQTAEAVALAKFDGVDSAEKLTEAWTSLTKDEKKIPAVLATKDKLKTQFP